jgi:hypothetical protein
VLVEATIPLSPELASLDWEVLLTGKNYKKVWFDGLNNFYLSQEHADLERYFETPPNVHDGIVIPIACGHPMTSEYDLLMSSKKITWFFLKSLSSVFDFARQAKATLLTLFRSNS